MLPSLKGVFPQPKVPHRRNFLRENKLNLKDIQKNSHRHHIQAKEENKLEEQRRSQRHKSLDLRPVLSQARPVSCCSCQCQSSSQGTTLTRKESSEKSVPKEGIETCNQEVQTDDIFDEEFLYQALKRCSSLDNEKDLFTDNIEKQDNYRPKSSCDTKFNFNDHNLNFEHLTIETDRLPPTTASTSTQVNPKRMPRRQSERGDRYEIRLPKYLEREKYERELQKQRELMRDRNCPEGYVSLSEDDRQLALENAERRFKILINELNHMPMTTETLRLRCRKVEIERELVEIENDIRIFSKPKVYIKSNAI